MSSPLSLLFGPRYRTLVLGLLAGWTLSCLALLLYFQYAESEERFLVMRAEAMATIRKDLAYRIWVTHMGGVYVDSTRVAPNPYLAHLANRDLLTDKGAKLTLVNPAYMTRMVLDEANQVYGPRSHLTSLSPLRPENSPDPWETGALKRFETGERDFTERLAIDGKPVLRHMTAFVTEAGCLKCHASQGYKVGDVRGGLSVTVPYEGSWYDKINRSSHAMVLGLVGLWLFGSLGIVALSHRVVSATASREEAQERLLNQQRDALAAITEREARFEGMVKSLQAGYFSLDVEGRYTEVNATWLAMHGYKEASQVLGRHFSLALAEAQHPLVYAAFARLLSGQPVRMDLNRHLRSDGTFGWHATSALPVYRQGRVCGVDGFLVDLTELCNAKADSELLLTEMAEPFALCELLRDADGRAVDFRLVKANPAFFHLLSQPTGSLEGRLSRELFPGLDQGLLTHFDEVVRSGKALSLECYMPSLSRFLSIRAYRPKPGFFACTFVDNTDSRRAREALEREEAELSAVYNQAPVMMAVVDRQRRIRRVNRALAEFVGRSESEIANLKAGPLISCIHAFDVPAGCGEGPDCGRCEFRKCIIETLEHGVTHRRHEVSMNLLRDGKATTHTLLLSTAMLHLGDEPVALLCIEDVTKTRRLEGQLLRMQRLESLGSLATGVAHDLNNILVPIMMSTDLLAPLAKGPDMEGVIQLLRSSAQRGAGILRQLLLFGRGAEVHRCSTEPSALLSELSHIIRETFPKNITFRCEVPDGLACIDVDPTQIHQVLLNLCVNARDAMPKGGTLTVRASNVVLSSEERAQQPGALPGPYLRFSVIDTGTGIPAAVIDKIFDPFFTTKPIGQGTGLGLSTVQGIVSSHGGFVIVESTPGRGTAFHVNLPATARDDAIAATEEDLRAFVGNGQLILVIDDEASIRQMMRLGLSSHGYRVIDASDGAIALSTFAAQSSEISLVICDLMMPHMDGRAALDCIRSIRNSVPLIAISGVVQAAQGLQQIPGDPVLLLQKPFELGDMLRLVHTVLHPPAS